MAVEDGGLTRRAWLSAPAAVLWRKGLEISAATPAGNVVVERIADGAARIRQGLRDTEGDWYWRCFEASGAGAGKVTSGPISLIDAGIGIQPPAAFHRFGRLAVDATSVRSRPFNGRAQALAGHAGCEGEAENGREAAARREAVLLEDALFELGGGIPGTGRRAVQPVDGLLGVVVVDVLHGLPAGLEIAVVEPDGFRRQPRDGRLRRGRNSLQSGGRRDGGSGIR
jgi:hypothetical protein